MIWVVGGWIDSGLPLATIWGEPCGLVRRGQSARARYPPSSGRFPSVFPYRSLEPANSPNRPQIAERARCLRVILAEVYEMIDRAEAAAAGATVASLRALVRHYEAELRRLQASENASRRVP